MRRFEPISILAGMHQGEDNRFLGQSYCAHLMFVAQAICTVSRRKGVGDQVSGTLGF